jgi:flagellar protein FlbD
MIVLHKLNAQEIVVNAELIETLEPGPQTVIHLATGNKVLVSETKDEVIAKVVEYRKSVNASGRPANPIAGYERGPA